MTPDDPDGRESLIEAVASAHRAIDPFTRVARAHHAWHDLDEEGRQIAYERALLTRELEVALRGQTSTALAVLDRIR